MGIANCLNTGAGTTGQVLATQGASSPPNYVNNTTTSCGQLLSTQTASSSSVVQFTSVISGTYINYRVIGYGITTTNQNFWLQMSANNGTSYITTSYSANSIEYVQSGTPSAALATNAATTAVKMATSLPTSGAYTASIILDIFNPAGGYVNVRYIVAFYNNGSSIYGATRGSGFCTSSSAINAIQFLSNGGNFPTGTFKMYGLN